MPHPAPHRSPTLWLIAVSLTGACRPAPEVPPDLMGFSEEASAAQAGVEARILGGPSADRMQEYHRAMTAEPHHAGTEANEELAEYFAERLFEFGFDSVHMARYEVPLPRPVERSVALVAPVERELALVEPPLDADPDTRLEGVLPPFNAFSPDGEATADVVYVNYGMPADYQVLDSLGISVAGRIVLARYGNGWRGIKPRLAAERGAVGALLYSDPADDGFSRGPVMPEGKWRPEHGVQRGSVLDMPRYPGDPQTPGRPSVSGADRIPLAEAPTIGSIPVQPISYGDAEPILASLEGQRAPDAWQGGLDLEYRMGPGPARVHMRLRFDWSTRPIVNVIGLLLGSEEPERVVMAGGHRDAWTFGGRDPISGAVSLLETARVIGEAARAGLRPRRTIAIASWDGEEYGLLGSTEYGEEWAAELSENLVTYVNRESYTAGDFNAAGSHALQPLLNAVTKRVAQPEADQGVSVWDGWLAAAPEADVISASGDGPEIRIGALGSGSDFTVFLDHLGVPSLNLGFSSENGIYHSRYDTHWYYTRYGDPGFAHGERLAEVVALFLTRLANADFLPFDYGATGETVDRYLDQVSEEAGERGMDLDLSRARRENRRLRGAAASLSEELPRIFRGFTAQELAAFRTVRYEVNRHLISVERGFLHPEGLPGRPWYRHQLYAPGLDTGYGVKTLPGVREAVERGDEAQARAMLEVLSTRLEEATSRLRRAVLLARGIIPQIPQSGNP